MNDRARFWFPAKRYGWGWGLPVRWQGWLVIAVYFVFQYLGIRHFEGQGNGRGLAVYLVVVTALLLVVVVIKGERPVRWRWGGR